MTVQIRPGCAGTDIPRLQVCCHISAVKTELYFRQVLGRILRVNDKPNQQAWLYTFAEANLIECAERIEQGIPDTCSFSKLGLVVPPHHSKGSSKGTKNKAKPPFQANKEKNQFG